MMYQKIEGKFREVAGAIQKLWGYLTADRARELRGEKKRMAGIMQQHGDYDADRADDIVELLYRRYSQADHVSADSDAHASLQ